MADVIPFNPVGGVAREEVDGDELRATAAWTVEDPRRLRAHFFNGRFLTARDLTREQQYALIRQADLGQASGGGVINGLTVSRHGPGQLFIAQGTGITPAGETVVVRSGQSIDVMRMPVAERFGEEPSLELQDRARVGNRSGVFAVCLRAVEYTAYPATAYPTGVNGKRKIEEGDIIEASTVVFLPLTPDNIEQATTDVRAHLAREVFVHGGALKLSGTVLPLAVVLLDRGHVVWVDPYLVRRELGADAVLGFGLTPRSTRVSYWWQYWSHLQDTLRDRAQRGLNFRFQAREHFEALPPFGLLPRQAVDVNGQKLVQWFFPQEMPLELTIVPQDELLGLLEESLTLAPIDLNAPSDALEATPVSILMTVPRGDLSRLSTDLSSTGAHISERTARPTARVQPIDALASLWQRRNPAPLAPSRPVDLAPWQALLNRSGYLYYIRRRQFSPVSYAVPRYARVDNNTDPLTITARFPVAVVNKLVAAEERANVVGGSRALLRFDILMRRARDEVWDEAGKLFAPALFDTKVFVNGAVAELAYRARVRVRDLGTSSSVSLPAQPDADVRVRALRVEDIQYVKARYQVAATGFTQLVAAQAALDTAPVRMVLASTLLIPELARAGTVASGLAEFASSVLALAQSGQVGQLRKAILARAPSA